MQCDRHASDLPHRSTPTTRIAAFVASGEMAVTYFLFHAPRSFWPILNRGEIVVAFCFFFLYVAARGAGRFSLDTMLFRNRSLLHT